MSTLKRWSLISAVRDTSVLESTLLRSPDIDDRCEIILKPGFPCIGDAYNEGIEQASAEILVFAHTDVYLPTGWLERIAAILDELAVTDPNWGVLGVYGIAANGVPAGHVYSTGLGQTIGRPFQDAIETKSLDELLLIVRKSSGLRFDPKLPGFHLYATDICLEAAKRGLKSYIVSAFCIHNSIGIRYLPRAFWKSYFYMRSKWTDCLPVRTCCVTISNECWPLLDSVRTAIHRLVFPSTVGKRCADPQRLYEQLLMSHNGDTLVTNR